MPENDLRKKELEKELEEVKQRLKILDMIDERLFKIKDLANEVVKDNMTDKEIRQANEKVQKLKEEVMLLEVEKTKLS